MTMRMRSTYRRQTAATITAPVAAIAIVSAQTKVTPRAIQYSVQEDAKLVQEAAGAARRQVPPLRIDSTPAAAPTQAA